MPSNSPIPARLEALRRAMRDANLAAYVIPSSDPHLSEYLPARWQGRQHFSGFNGSVGTLLVTPDFAGLWVDSRYWAQAEKELAGTGVQMMKISSAAATLHIDWLTEHVAAGATVGADGAVLGLSTARLMMSSFVGKKIKLDTSHDLLDSVWPDRPSLPNSPIYAHLTPFATQTRAEKLSTLRASLNAKGAHWHFISTVDDLAWLFNLRGADVSYNPVFIAHALVGLESACIFIEAAKVPPEIRTALAQDGVEIAPYTEAVVRLKALNNTSLLIDPKRITFQFQQAIGRSVTVFESINPTALSKSRKSAAEAQFVRATMEQDGAALCEFFSWLEQSLHKSSMGSQTQDRITEIDIDEKINAARARRAHFVSPSFATIAGYNANGAMPHYRATPESHAVIEGDGLLLIDSGGQYQGGTTDITRVMPVGKVSAEQKRDFTLVLKGMIALSVMRFPRGTFSTVLDTAARAPMWAEGINYGHGTGHGVGYFLNVHEGPQSITAYATPDANMVMESGMITSNEPGIYRLGKWGVRIENLLLCVPAETSEFGEFLQFETLTLCPIDTRCIDLKLMNEDEIDWLNNYHAQVLARLSPLVQGHAQGWLIERTLAI
jgi:Xaa-Pro aminopeptidase